MSTLDELAPITGDNAAGAERFTLSLSEPTEPVRAFQAFNVSVDYGGADPVGVILPLVLTIVGPSASSFRRRVYELTAPTTLPITLEEGGEHVLRLFEPFGNRSFGALTVTAQGETADVSGQLPDLTP